MEFSKGNEKIGKDTLIFNMEPAHDCTSSKLGLCKIGDKCYAKKAEDQYHHCVPAFRKRQQECWKNEKVEDIVEQIIKKVKNSRKYKINYVRFNESGDFENQESLEKLKKLCSLLKKNEVTKDVVVYGYTARSDLDFKNLPANLVINGSGFMVSNEYKAVEGSSINRYTNYCPGMAHKHTGGCKGCTKCKKATGQTIYAGFH